MTPDALHTHLLQVGAAVHVGTAVLSYMALRFNSRDHKKAVLTSRIAVSWITKVLPYDCLWWKLHSC